MSKDEPETVTPHLERVLSRLLRRRSRSRLADGLTRQIGRAEPESDSGKKISTRRWSSACNGTSHFYKWFQRGQPSWLDCGTHKVPKYCLFCRNNKIKYSRPFHCTITNVMKQAVPLNHISIFCKLPRGMRHDILPKTMLFTSYRFNIPKPSLQKGSPYWREGSVQLTYLYKLRLADFNFANITYFLQNRLP